MSNNNQTSYSAKLNEFFYQHAVFTIDELDNFLSKRGSNKSNTRKSLIAYYMEQGRIIRIRRGLYATVPFGAKASSNPVDPFFIAAKMTEDAVLAYHTALEYQGKAYSLYTKLFYISNSRSLPLKFQTYEIKSVPVPHSLQSKGEEMFGVIYQKHSGVELRVTNLERTFVDMLDRPNLTGSWEEIWRSLESVEFYDLDQVIAYTFLLENSTTAAKVGFFLEQHKETLMVEDTYLDQLRKLRPKEPHYLIRNKRKNCKWVKSWNLMIPVEILNKSWEEVL